MYISGLSQNLLVLRPSVFATVHFCLDDKDNNVPNWYYDPLLKIAQQCTVMYITANSQLLPPTINLLYSRYHSIHHKYKYNIQLVMKSYIIHIAGETIIAATHICVHLIRHLVIKQYIIICRPDKCICLPHIIRRKSS